MQMISFFILNTIAAHLFKNICRRFMNLRQTPNVIHVYFFHDKNIPSNLWYTSYSSPPSWIYSELSYHLEVLLETHQGIYFAIKSERIKKNNVIQEFLA